MELRYTLNAKSFKESKLSKKKQHEKVTKLFNPEKNQKDHGDDFAKRIAKLNALFVNKK